MGIDEFGNSEGADASADSGTSAERPDQANEQRPEQPETQRVEDAGEAERRREPSETLTREEYADHIRSQGSPIPHADDSDRDAAQSEERADAGGDADVGEAAGPRESDAALGEGRDQAEPRDRETYADDMRGDGARPVHDDEAAGLDDEPAEAAPNEANRDERDAGQEAAEQEAAEPLSREEYADRMREAQPSDADEEQTAEGPDSGEADSAHETQDDEQDKAYVDGHEIEVSHDPADGAWIEGLPGEVPDKTGEVFAGAEERKRTRTEKVLGWAVEKGDDVSDSTEKTVNLLSDVFTRPPTHAEVPVQVAHYAAPIQHSEVDPGSLATAALALSIMTCAGGRWLHGKLKGTDGARN